jgi:hypothetical protein
VIQNKLCDKRDDITFPIVNFPFISSNISAPAAYVSQGMKQTYLYLWYPLFQAQWDRCGQQNHQT